MIRQKEGLDRGILVLVGVGLVVFGLYRIISYDVWWQIRTGEWIVQNGFAAYDPFNYVASELPWIEMRWLYSVFVFLVFEALGLNALIVVKIIFLGLTFFLLGRVYRGENRWVVILGLVVTLAATHSRFFVRPELVTFLLLTFFLFCLYRYKSDKNVRWLYLLPLLQVVWTNSHTLFILGPVVLWLFALVELVAPRVLDELLPAEPEQLSWRQLRPVFGTAVVVTLVCLINPYFLEGALFPLQLFGEINSGHVVKTLIAEFLSPFAYAGFNLPYIAYLVITGLSILGFVLNYRRLAASGVVIWAVFFYLSLLAVRNVALFGFVAGFMIIREYGRFAGQGHGRERWRQPVSWGVRIGAVGFVVVMMGMIVTNAYYRNDDRAFGLGVAVARFPIQAMSFIRAEGLPEPVLNNLGDGGYLIFEGGAGTVYSDGRLEVYGGEHVAAAIRLFQTGEGLDEVVARQGIRTVLLRHYSDQGLLNVLEDDPGWQPVYYDSQYVVYLRESEQTAELVERLAVDWQNPEPPVALPLPEWVPPPLLSDVFPSVARNREQLLLGELFLGVGSLDRALAYFEEALALGPVNETVHFYRGVIFRAKGEEGEAADIFARLDENFLKQAAAHIFAGKIYSEAGNNRAALAAYQQGIALGGRTEGNYREVVRLALLQADYLAAVTALLELAELRPEDAGIWNELGLIYVAVGDGERARRAFEQALVVDPGNEAARGNLEELGGD